jgi:glycerol uptake facilitator-like aquaporin
MAGVLLLTARAESFAPVATGLGLRLIHLIGIPVTNVSANPARSTGPALFGRRPAATLQQRADVAPFAAL